MDGRGRRALAMSPREQLNFLFKPLIMFSPIINILEQGVIFFPCAVRWSAQVKPFRFHRVPPRRFPSERLPLDYQMPITPFSKIRWQWRGAIARSRCYRAKRNLPRTAQCLPRSIARFDRSRIVSLLYPVREHQHIIAATKGLSPIVLSLPTKLLSNWLIMWLQNPVSVLIAAWRNSSI